MIDSAKEFKNPSQQAVFQIINNKNYVYGL